MNRERPRVREWHEVRERVKGGYLLLSRDALLVPLWARLTGVITAFDYRVWWLAVELTKRRSMRGASVCCNYDDENEWSVLLGGVAACRVRRARRRLERLGLVTWTSKELKLFDSTTELAIDHVGYAEFVSRLGRVGGRETIPVQRHAVRELLGPVGKGRAATMLGVLVRVLYRRKIRGLMTVASGGFVSATWISEVFGVGLATVKHAMRDLRASGWLVRLDTPKWCRERRDADGYRLGARTVVNLEWVVNKPCVEETNGTKTTPRSGETCAISTPLESHSDLLTATNHQTASKLPESGLLRKEGTPSPQWTKIRHDDLLLRPRCEALFRDAMNRGIVADASMMLFFASAKRAATRGTKNPCGMFRRLVEGRLWHHLTEAEVAAGRKAERCVRERGLVNWNCVTRPDAEPDEVSAVVEKVMDGLRHSVPKRSAA